MNWIFFLALISQIESGNNPNLIGDKHLANKAYGVYQMRKIFVDDVNRISGFKFTLEEVVGSDSLSRWCIVYYLKHYGKLYTKKTGKLFTMEVAAMIYNGGPNGWNKISTIKYRNKFNLAMKNWPPPTNLFQSGLENTYHASTVGANANFVATTFVNTKNRRTH